MELLISVGLAIIGLIIVFKIFGLAVSIVWSLLVGLVIGGVASVFVKTKSAPSKPAMALYGVAGSLAGKTIGGLFGLGTLVTLGLSVAAAALLISVLSAR